MPKSKRVPAAKSSDGGVINIPVFESTGNSTPVAPAAAAPAKIKLKKESAAIFDRSLISKIESQTQAALIGNVQVDEATLSACLNTANALTQAVKGKIKEAKLDSLAFQLGIAATGKVGFLGTGLDVQVSAVIQISFKF